MTFKTTLTNDQLKNVTGGNELQFGIRVKGRARDNYYGPSIDGEVANDPKLDVHDLLGGN